MPSENLSDGICLTVQFNTAPSSRFRRRAHRDKFAVAVGNTCGDGLALFGEGDRVGVFRNAVESCAVFRGKGFEFVQRACFFKYFGVKLDGGHGAEHTGAAAGVFFGRFGVRCRVGAEEEFVRLLAGNGGNQCLTVGFAFEYGQAEMMGGARHRPRGRCG